MTITKINQKKDSKTYYKEKDRIGQYLAEKRNSAVLKHLKGKVVDLGCGDNFLLGQYSGEGIGVDIVNYGKADVVLKNFNQLPFENDSLDTVTIVGSLNYFDEPISVLQEVKRVLKKDGQLILTMPNAIIMKIWHKFRENWAFHSGYSYKELNELVEKGGMRIESYKPFLFFLNYVYFITK